jgi:hypothetical protein
MKRLKISSISSYSGEKKALAIRAIVNLIGTGVDGLIVHLINQNVSNEVLKIIGIALFGIGAVEGALATLIYTGALGYFVYEDIKERREK